MDVLSHEYTGSRNESSECCARYQSQLPPITYTAPPPSLLPTEELDRPSSRRNTGRPPSPDAEAK